MAPSLDFPGWKKWGLAAGQTGCVNMFIEFWKTRLRWHMQDQGINIISSYSFGSKKLRAPKPCKLPPRACPGIFLQQGSLVWEHVWRLSRPDLLRSGNWLGKGTCLNASLSARQKRKKKGGITWSRNFGGSTPFFGTPCWEKTRSSRQQGETPSYWPYHAQCPTISRHGQSISAASVASIGWMLNALWSLYVVFLLPGALMDFRTSQRRPGWPLQNKSWARCLGSCLPISHPTVVDLTCCDLLFPVLASVESMEGPCQYHRNLWDARCQKCMCHVVSFSVQKRWCSGLLLVSAVYCGPVGLALSWLKSSQRWAKRQHRGCIYKVTKLLPMPASCACMKPERSLVWIRTVSVTFSQCWHSNRGTACLAWSLCCCCGWPACHLPAQPFKCHGRETSWSWKNQQMY